MRYAAALAAGMSVFVMIHAGVSVAADVAGSCCADLEARIAELETAVASKGNRSVTLTIAGQVNQAVMFWDDGAQSDAYVVGDKNDQSNFSFIGDAKVGPAMHAGYEMVIRIRDTLSDDVDQDRAQRSGDWFQIWQMHWYVEHERLGKVSIGRGSRITDTAPENDLSETGVAAYAGVQDIGGAFAMRRADGLLAGLAWGDVYNHFNGDTADVIRYDTPQIMGFVASASWGADDIWDVGLKWEGGAKGLKAAASVAYAEVHDTPSDFADLDHSTWVGSAAVLHEATGLNALISAGIRSFDRPVIDTDGALRKPEDAKFVYAKVGWLAKLNGLGQTAFYGEYGWFRDFISAQDNTADEDGNGIGDALDVSASLGGARIAGNTAQVWGAGVVQHVEEAEMQIYLGYRLHEADFDLRDAANVVAPGAALDSFHTFIMGSKIAF